MPVMSMLVPFRDVDGSRTQILDWCLAYWAHHLPDAEVIVSDDDGVDPFSKTVAVNRAAESATSDVFAIVDADVVLHPHLLRLAANHIRSGKAPWVRPRSTVRRLNESRTAELMAGDPTLPLPTFSDADCERVTRAVGLVCVFPRSAFVDVGGMDPRFRGWGWEDNAWDWLLDGLVGPAASWAHEVVHLWHPQAQDGSGKRMWPGQTQRNSAAGRRYRRARGRPTALRRIADEVRELTGISPEDALDEPQPATSGG